VASGAGPLDHKSGSPSMESFVGALDQLVTMLAKRGEKS